MVSQGQSQQPVLEWSLPIVHDCLREFYFQHFPLRSAGFRLLTGLHFSLWTSLVLGDFDAARADDAALAQKADGLKLDFDICGAANRYVAAELLNLSLRRFRRMPEEAKTNNQALLDILVHLNRSASPSAPVTQAYRRAA
ncbi:hypothetical protein CCR94_06755 [Rhodoblastus sphagnicola]|uniref:Uncharacterized protein n=1 Tax=Rhodoblastus sphagnicola TaxID=333368 RepID=A0A2S6NBY0_9HYPH|nr:hypothetical protein [Rhodoblastus sphagnicola]MBB4198697.1 hypothetical protein [Rhodoblastus sphagnicola]PPQ32119.1 hypothetical protein CCR94_06755 [Rhodoblastus sphagnicola]